MVIFYSSTIAAVEPPARLSIVLVRTFEFHIQQGCYRLQLIDVWKKHYSRESVSLLESDSGVGISTVNDVLLNFPTVASMFRKCRRLVTLMAARFRVRTTGQWVLSVPDRA